MSKPILLVNGTLIAEIWDYTIKSFVVLERSLNRFRYTCSGLPPKA
jgi:hypothetical protein